MQCTIVFFFRDKNTIISSPPIPNADARIRAISIDVEKSRSIIVVPIMSPNPTNLYRHNPAMVLGFLPRAAKVAS
jgi:hypothetical protein